MNTNPKAKRILCFGDSNTWGRIPGKKFRRFPVDQRWTGILQKLLGEDYEVIEEGLTARVVVGEAHERRGKNAAKYLISCLEAHFPLDLVILMVGVNDLQSGYKQLLEGVVSGMEELINMTRSVTRYHAGEAAKVIVMLPHVIDGRLWEHFEGSEEKSKKLSGLYKDLAKAKECDFLDMAKIVSVSSVDGVHLAGEEQRKLAEAVEARVQGIFKT